MKTLTETEIGEIRQAIREEQRVAKVKIPFVVRRRSVRDGLWEIEVDDSDPKASPLRDTYEGYTAWWPEPVNGCADVLTVDPDRDRLFLRYATEQPPDRGGQLFLIPIAYLDAMEAAWGDPLWVAKMQQWLATHGRGGEFAPHRAMLPPKPTRLREAQRRSFGLTGWGSSFLWGPPGTGKTYTLGEMIASYLLRDTTSRVLLLSNTNTAVDHALIAVDAALDSRPPGDAVNALRDQCFRIGSRYEAWRYQDRRHLIPVADEKLLKELIAIEQQRPDPTDAHAYASWKQSYERARDAVRVSSIGVLRRARLAAITTTGAAFQRNALAEGPAFDLVVFDEASQVSMPHALALIPLGKSVLFAGDPRQLAPVVQSKHELARKWLEDSPFVWMDEAERSCVQLTEQSRMAEGICKVVSGVFYNGKLQVAKDALQNPAWRAERDLADVPPVGSDSAAVVQVEREGWWSQKNGGSIRPESAEMVVELVSQLTGRGLDASDILVVTPFHAQRALIRQKLRHCGATMVSISTVHKSQGGERHTVIFDPVEGNGKFFREVVGQRRLVNVALSRAKARLVVLLSRGDLENQLLKSVATLIAPPHTDGPVTSIDSLIARDDFPACAVGQTIRIRTITGIVEGVTDGGRKFALRDLQTGELRTMVTAYVRQAVRD